MENLSLHHQLRRLAIVIIAVFTLCCIGACSSDDEPEITSIDYYLSIQTPYAIYRSGALPPPPKEDMIGKLTLKMKKRIHEAYPERDMQGNDAAVLVACDEVYKEYRETGLKSNTMCVATLYRARMSGMIIKQSTPIKQYSF